MNSVRFLSQQRRLEKNFRTAEAFISNSNNVSVGQFVCFLLLRTFTSGFKLCVIIKSNVTELLFDIADNFSFS